MLHAVGRIREWWNGETRADVNGADTGDGITIPSRTDSTRSVTVGEAFGLPMVYRAIQIHAFSGKQLSIGTFRNGRSVAQHRLVERPDPFISRAAWIEQAIVSLASTGNCYHEIIGDEMDPAALSTLNPLDVIIQTNSAGRVTAYKYRGREIKPSRMKHSTLMRIPGSAYGLGPIQAAQADLRGAIDTRDYAANWMDAGGQPNGVLKTDQVLSADQAKQYKNNWNESAGAKNGVAVIGQGLSYSPIFLSPKDVQFIEAQQFNVTTIARMFGTPASLMLAAVEGNSQTYANVEQDWLAYVRFTLMGYLVEIEEMLTSCLPAGRSAKFNVEALLRADTTTRYQSFRTAIEAGFMSVDEVRDLEHLAPIGPADTSAQTARAVAELVQKIYLGVGTVLTPDEAREIANRAGAGLVGELAQQEDINA